MVKIERRGVKRQNNIRAIGVLLILIPFIKPLFGIVAALIVSKGDLNFMLFRYAPSFQKIFVPLETALTYMGIESLFDKLYYICSIDQAKIISRLVLVTKILIPLLCKLGLIISGVGFFLRKSLFRLLAVVALSILSALGILNTILMAINFKQYYLLSLTTYISFGWLAYYLTRKNIKNQFKQ